MEASDPPHPPQDASPPSPPASIINETADLSPVYKSSVVQTKSRTWLPLLILPYLVGIVWHAIHPMASVLTGDFKAARRWYIDENSIDPSYFNLDVDLSSVEHNYHQRRRHDHQPQPIASFCQALHYAGLAVESEQDQLSVVTCRAQGNQVLEVATLIPTRGFMASVTESLVVVVPPSADWMDSPFHVALLALIDRLAHAPWLAKSIFFISPLIIDPTLVTTNGNSSGSYPTMPFWSLHDTVDYFLHLELGSTPSDAGSRHHHHQGQNMPSGVDTMAYAAWNRCAGTMIRQLIVLDVLVEDHKDQVGRSAATEVRILPQGRRGLLPNMDLVFVAMLIYVQGNYVPRARLVMHPWSHLADSLWEHLYKHLPAPLHEAAESLVELLLFEYTLWAPYGSSPPHAPALDREIDALTIQGVFRGPSDRPRNQFLLVLQLEFVLRALSNLHERLHHSTSLYLLSSPERFIKHEEYLIPNLLLIIPVVARALTMVVLDGVLLDLNAMGWASGVLLASVAWVSYALEFVSWASPYLPWLSRHDQVGIGHVVVGLLYLALWFQRRTAAKYSGTLARQSIQFIACLFCLSLHVGLAFGHVSLAFPSALLWTPLIAFPCYRTSRSDRAGQRWFSFSALLGWVLAVATGPGFFLVPHIYTSYNPYVRYCYLPLHLLFTLLQITR